MIFKHKIRLTLDLKLPPKVVFPDHLTVEQRLAFLRDMRGPEFRQLPTGSPFSRVIHPCQYKYIFRQLYFVTIENDPKHKNHETIRQLAFRKLNKKHYNDHRHQFPLATMGLRVIEGFYHQGNALSWWPVLYTDNDRIDRNYVTDLLYGAMGPARISPEFKTSTVVSILRGIRESEDFSVMPLVADALQDAGCNDEHLINRLRETNHFSLGDWLFKAFGMVG